MLIQLIAQNSILLDTALSSGALNDDVPQKFIALLSSSY